MGKRIEFFANGSRRVMVDGKSRTYSSDDEEFSGSEVSQIKADKGWRYRSNNMEQRAHNPLKKAKEEAEK